MDENFCRTVQECSRRPYPLLKNRSEEKDGNRELRARIKQIEEELKISRLKGMAYQIMVDFPIEEYGLDLVKKPGAKQSKGSKMKNRK